MCFSAAFIIGLLIQLVIICVVVGIVRIVLPIVLGWLGIAGDVVMRVLNLILAAVVIIWLLYLLIDVLRCVGVH
jgi:hypothetical protein